MTLWRSHFCVRPFHAYWELYQRFILNLCNEITFVNYDLYDRSVKIADIQLSLVCVAMDWTKVKQNLVIKTCNTFYDFREFATKRGKIYHKIRASESVIFSIGGKVNKNGWDRVQTSCDLQVQKGEQNGLLTYKRARKTKCKCRSSQNLCYE